MRKSRHLLLKSKSGKTVYLCMEFEDNGGKRRIYLAKVHRWKTDLASRFFKFESDGWSDEVSRAFIGLNALRISKNSHEGSSKGMHS